jgi:hypothetical protein
MEFSAITAALTHNFFLPTPFGVESVFGTQNQLAYLPVKFAGLAIPDPTAITESNWSASTVLCGHISVTFRNMTD